MSNPIGLRTDIYRADDLKCVYLDQEYPIIDNSLIVAEQIQRFNRHSLPGHEFDIRPNRLLYPNPHGRNHARRSAVVRRCDFPCAV